MLLEAYLQEQRTAGYQASSVTATLFVSPACLLQYLVTAIQIFNIPPVDLSVPSLPRLRFLDGILDYPPHKLTQRKASRGNDLQKLSFCSAITDQAAQSRYHGFRVATELLRGAKPDIFSAIWNLRSGDRMRTLQFLWFSERSKSERENQAVPMARCPIPGRPSRETATANY